MITIREIEHSDLKGLCQLYEDLIGRKTDYETLEAVFNKINNDEHYHIIGAFRENELVGSVMGILCHDIVGDCRPFMVIENVVVSSNVRRQGVGVRLMEHIELTAKKKDCYYMIFVSGGQRTEAHAFYEKLGFKDEKVEGYRKHFY